MGCKQTLQFIGSYGEARCYMERGDNSTFPCVARRRLPARKTNKLTGSSVLIPRDTSLMDIAAIAAKRSCHSAIPASIRRMHFHSSKRIPGASKYPQFSSLYFSDVSIAVETIVLQVSTFSE